MTTQGQVAGDTAVLREIRDSLARPFGDALDARVPQVLDMLEHQLALSEDRSKWKPLKGAIELLKALRPALGARVAKEVAARFDAKVNPSESGFGQTASFSLDSLALVAEDDVQEEIAVGNTTKRLKEQLGDELFALTRRVAAVMDLDDLPDDRNPVFPRVFARALLDALGEGGADSASRLAAFSGFGPAVLEEVASAYSATNQMLRQRGVLPDFKRSYGAPVQVPRRGAAAGPTGYYPSAASDPAPAAAHGQSPMVTASPLDRLFVLVGSAPAAAAGPASFPAGSAAVHQAKQEMRASLTPDDLVVADLVAALFDRLFTDARLTDATRAQVGRLQLPVFKAVLRDRSFFSDRRHPIRGLIDTMAELGASDEAVAVDGKSPSRWIALVVGEILERHAEDAQAFARALPRLARVLERHREAALEQDAEVRELRSREENLTAIREASLAIAHRLTAGSYPQEVAPYLYGRFREVLVHDFRAGGEATPNWNADLEVLDDILWILTPRVSAEERARLVSLLPSLLLRLKMGYQRAGRAPEEATQAVDELKQLLDEVMRAPVAAAHGALRKVPTPMPPDDYTATLHVTSASLLEEGFARGVWIEFTEDDGTKRRCRLNWMSPVQGTCVFKDLDRNRSFAISVDELRDKRRAGRAAIVDGPGVAQSTIEGAIADVARELGAS